MADWKDKIREYKEYTRMMEELTALKDAIASDLKAMMTEAGESKMVIGEYKLSYTEATRTDIDKKRLQAEHEELYSQYLKESKYMRFAIA